MPLPAAPHLIFRTRVAALLLFALLLASPVTAWAAEHPAAGHWEGTITLPGAELAVQVDLKNPSDVWQGTLDIPAQGVRAFKLGEITVQDSAVSFTMPNAPGNPVFDGTLGDDGETITGDFIQHGATLPFKVSRTPKTERNRATPDQGIPGDGLAGFWQGSLDANGLELRLLFKVEATQGRFSGSLQSLDQNPGSVPISEVTQTGPSVKLKVAANGGGFSGQLNAEGSEIVGEWIQGVNRLPLTLRRLAAAPASRRPQDPTPPYPYRVDEVVFRNDAANLALAGTLTVPDTPGPHPAVVLISGSGPQDRDETLMGHRPFLVLADHLTRHGIAVLRYDDRGFGASEGDFAGATTTDFTADALAAWTWLRDRPEVNPTQIGLIGHSEGGLVAAQAAATLPEIGFIVLLAGPGVPLSELIPRQIEDVMVTMGVDADLIARQAQAQREIFRIVLEQGDTPDATEQLRAALNDLGHGLSEEQRASLGFTPPQIDAYVHQVLTPWYREFLGTDPRPILEQVACPVLALNGAKDLQVAAADNLAAIDAALKKGGNADVTVINFPDLNHLFQHADTGSPVEYAMIEETINPAVLDVITDWITRHTQIVK